jgi:hypothetical protein
MEGTCIPQPRIELRIVRRYFPFFIYHVYRAQCLRHRLLGSTNPDFLLTWNCHLHFMILKKPDDPSKRNSHFLGRATRRGFASGEERLFPCLQKFGFYNYSSSFEGGGIWLLPRHTICRTDINSFVKCMVKRKCYAQPTPCDWQDEWRLAHCPSNELSVKTVLLTKHFSMLRIWWRGNVIFTLQNIPGFLSDWFPEPGYSKKLTATFLTSVRFLKWNFIFRMN